MAETSTKTQEKAKKLCYERRASSIIKKSKELQILCDVKIGVVILGPDGKLESWPPGLGNAKALLDACKGMPNVRSEKRKSPENSNSHSSHEILNQRGEFFKSSGGKGKEIASKKKKEFHEGYTEILNSKLELLNKREMVFFNGEAKEIPSMERIESLCNDIVAAYGQDGADVLTQNLYDDDDLGGLMDDFFFGCNYPQDNGKGKEIATIMENMDSGTLQDTAYHGVYETKLGPYFGFGAHQYDENVRELTSINCGMGPNQCHHGSNSVNHTLQEGSLSWSDACYQPTPLQKSFTALDNGLPLHQVMRKKVRLQNSTAALNHNLPSTCAEFWQEEFRVTDSLNNVLPLVDTVDLCKLQPRKNISLQNSVGAELWEVLQPWDNAT